MPDFFSEKFWNISCDENGLTRYGLHQVLNMFSESSLTRMLKKLGYDESLHSLKSRVFTLTFHTTAKLRVRICDALKTDLNERAWDLMMDYYRKKFGAAGAIQNDHCIVFRKHHNDSHSLVYGAVNKTDRHVEVIFKQLQSKNMLYAPSKGSVRTVVPPRSLVYLASSIVEPGATSYSYKYSFSSKYV